MNEIEQADLVTKEEMDDFIHGLFATQNPKCDPDWDHAAPSVSDIDGVEFVGQEEVNAFITGLFNN